MSTDIRLRLSFSEKELEELKRVAAAQNISLSEMTRRLCRSHLVGLRDYPDKTAIVKRQTQVLDDVATGRLHRKFPPQA